jgi:hypothetical protein
MLHGAGSIHCIGHPGCTTGIGIQGSELCSARGSRMLPSTNETPIRWCWFVERLPLVLPAITAKVVRGVTRETGRPGHQTGQDCR